MSRSAHNASAPRRESRAARTSESLLLAGIILGGLGTSGTMLPGGYSVFGPIKALLLSVAAAFVGLGLTAHPTLASSAAHRIARSRGAWAGLTLVGLALLATATSTHPVRSVFGHYPEYSGLLLLVVSASIGLGAFSLAEDERLVRTLGRSACIVLLAVSAYALAQAAGLEPLMYSAVYVVRRVRSTLGNSSNLGVFLVMMLPLAIWFARRERGFWRAAGIAATVAGALSLAWTLSRGAWLGAIMGVAAWLFVEGRWWGPRTRLRVSSTAVAALALAFVLTAVLVPSAASRLQRLANPEAGTAGWRLQVWAQSARAVAERPLLGYGPAAFRQVFTARRTAATLVGEGPDQVLDDPHNMVLSAAFGGGVFAALALIWLLVETLLAIWRISAAPGEANQRIANPLAAALAASVSAGAIALQFHFATLDTAPLLALLVGTALGRAAGRDEPRPTQGYVRLARLIRGASATVTLIAVVVAVATVGIVLADRAVARGNAARDRHVPWREACAEFEDARRLAPWEPAMTWASARAASQWVSAVRDPEAAADIPALAEATLSRMPNDPLATAQMAEAYLVAGQLLHDPKSLARALDLAAEAIRRDPQNGHRWGLKGAAAATLGDLESARSAYERAVLYAPDNEQAWAGLARVYQAQGYTDLARRAREHLSAIEP